MQLELLTTIVQYLYERLLDFRAAGRLGNCRLIFPNIEMRLSVGTVKGQWVNVHLLVSPEDPNHIDEINRILGRLTFDAYEDTFSCSESDLIRLGKRCSPSINDSLAARRRGTEQFKVSFSQLKQVIRDSGWAQANILVAVAGDGSAGSSGICDAADTTLRQEVERFAHVIFASSPAQREFWLGRGVLPPREVSVRYGGLKPCLHGSDAHDPRSVGMPDSDRYSWIKGDPTYDALRQACIDPSGRAFVGSEPPVTATASEVIAEIALEGAAWAQTPRLALNPGLVAIIGARGSEKRL